MKIFKNLRRKATGMRITSAPDHWHQMKERVSFSKVRLAIAAGVSRTMGFKIPRVVGCEKGESIDRIDRGLRKYLRPVSRVVVPHLRRLEAASRSYNAENLDI